MTTLPKHGMIFIMIWTVLIILHAVKGEQCTEIIQNIHYSCTGRNLSYIPASIPSSLETFDFSFNYLKSLYQAVFPQLYNLQVLDLTRCHVQRIADDAFHNVRNVTTLILTGNPIEYMGSNGLNSLQELQNLVLVDIGLSSLELHVNNLTKLQEFKFGTNNIQCMAISPYMINFKDFGLMDLHANNISVIKADHTAVLQEMGGNITIILSRNPISQIEPGAFQNIYLQQLDLRAAFASFNASRDGLKALAGLNVGRLVIGNYRDSFKIITTDTHFLDGLCFINFQEIYFLQREFSVENMHVFQCMVKATKITLKQCLLKYIEYIPFRRLKELQLDLRELYFMPVLQLSHQHTLEKLVITGNRPAVITDGFTDLPHLQYVDLSGNQITMKACCNNLFIGSSQLRHLNLSRNSEILLTINAFLGYKSLEVLDLHHTKLTTVGYYCLIANLIHLKYLDISYASITFMSPLSFIGLNSLKVLKVAGNSFHGDASHDVFANLTHLEMLDISDCGIEEMRCSSFKGLHKLKHLILSGNKLMALDFLTCPGLKKLTWLLADKNNIPRIPLNILQNLPANLSVFDLSFNPIDCSCSQTDFILWIINHQQILKQTHYLLCKTLSPGASTKVIDFDTDNCAHIRRVKVAVATCVVILFLLVSALAYKFQFYLRYCCILLRGYRTSRHQECPYDAFVIYSSKDEAWVMDELVENLEKGVPPIQLCLHVRDFEVGKSITSNIIDEGIMGSRKVIVVVSRHFINSAWCHFEFEVAQSWLVMEGNANIIIIILEDVEEERTKKVFGLHKYLKKNTYLKWRGNPLSNIRFWSRLRKAVITRHR